MQIYKPITNYIAAAGLALAVALTPQSTIAKENPCETLETQLAQCQEEQRKKALTPQERCAETREIQKRGCSVQYDFQVAEAREELWEHATLTKEYETDGRILELEKNMAEIDYKFCNIKAVMEERDCIDYKTKNIEVAKAPPKKAKKKKDVEIRNDSSKTGRLRMGHGQVGQLRMSGGYERVPLENACTRKCDKEYQAAMKECPSGKKVTGPITYEPEGVMDAFVIEGRNLCQKKALSKKYDCLDECDPGRRSKRGFRGTPKRN